jgi:hypothetical protein
MRQRCEIGRAVWSITAARTPLVVEAEALTSWYTQCFKLLTPGPLGDRLRS